LRERLGEEREKQGPEELILILDGADEGDRKVSDHWHIERLEPSDRLSVSRVAPYRLCLAPFAPQLTILFSSMSPKDEEPPADYNDGGYLQVKPSDLFKDGRYTIVRKLGCALPLPFPLGPP